MYCSQCGKQMQAEDRFCMKCGSKAVWYEENMQVPPEAAVTSLKKPGSGKKSEVIIVIIAVIVLIGTFYAIFYSWTKWNLVPLNYGNTAGNLINGAFVAEKGEWIYYINRSDGINLYKMRTDGTEKTKLNDDSSGFINVVGDWIYYTDEEDKIYKMRTDGTNRTKLNNHTASFINVVGEWVYFAQTQYGSSIGKLCKMRTDGTEMTIVSNDGSSFINVVSGRL